MQINGVTVERWSDLYTDASVLVSEELLRYLDAGCRTQYRASRVMEFAVEQAQRADWDAIGILCMAGGDPWQAGREVEHHGFPRYGNAHLCELARGEAEQERVTELLQQAQAWDVQEFIKTFESPAPAAVHNWQGWIIDDGILFYDIGARYTAEAVARLESDLSESALHDEERVKDLMEQVAKEDFRLPVVMDAEPDGYEVFRTYVRMNDGELCPECGIAVSAEEALKQHYGDNLVTCADCDDYVLWDGYGQRPQCCRQCERDRANASVADEQEEDGPRWQFDWSTGNGMVVNFGGTYWLWNTVAQVWEHVPQRWREAVNL